MNEEQDKQTPKQDAGKASSPASSGGGVGEKTGIGKFISGITSSLGIGRGKTDDSGASPGYVSTNLARQRIVLRGNANRLLYEKGKEKNNE